MKILRTVAEATQFLEKIAQPIGFVPTMGALHQGHLALLKKAKSENAVAGVSIFVNPMQFNNPEDFAKYPIDTENDVALLEAQGVDFLFLPNKEELLGSYTPRDFNLGNLDEVMEGPFRPGHFQGVANIVHLLFDVIRPQQAYFGEKDFQQLAVIRRMVELEKLPIRVVGCPTIREENGLALSSRNRRLDEQTKAEAASVSRFICSLDEKYADGEPMKQIRADLDALLATYGFRLDYFEFCTHTDLVLLPNFDREKEANACIAYYAGEVRLIDNCYYPPLK